MRRKKLPPGSRIAKTVWLTKHVAELAQKYADADDRTLSAIVEKALVEWLNKFGPEFALKNMPQTQVAEEPRGGYKSPRKKSSKVEIIK